MSIPRSRPAAVLVLCIGGAAVALATHQPGLVHVLGVMAPAAAFFLTLRAGRYPAERALLGLSTRRLGPVRIPAPSPAVRRCERALPRGGRLVAAALAGRAPPGAIGAPQRG